jgi:hypothetical protein
MICPSLRERYLRVVTAICRPESFAVKCRPGCWLLAVLADLVSVLLLRRLFQRRMVPDSFTMNTEQNTTIYANYYTTLLEFLMHYRDES